MQERHTNKKKYFEEQAYTTKEFVIPFLEQFITLDSSVKVLEVGCGEGGNLVPFLEKKCHVTGVDISESKISNAKEFLKEYTGNENLFLLAKDIYAADHDLEPGYDLIFMRDVIEHIHDQDRFMNYVKRFLKPDGLFFLAFPPWYNPFGGHQQICSSKLLSKLPYFHLFPPAIYRFILKSAGETASKTEALLEIKETGISIERFSRILKKHQYKVVKKTFFLINPNYKIKFGLKPREQSPVISVLPFLRNFFTTSVYFLVSQ